MGASHAVQKGNSRDIVHSEEYCQRPLAWQECPQCQEGRLELQVIDMVGLLYLRPWATRTLPRAAGSPPQEGRVSIDHQIQFQNLEWSAIVGL